ncbi:polymorphic toxin type 24 domain-containing protein [Psychrobacter arenosus]|uniref:polymorphic toxin type 24 domain-containing protein n=1 Tax=Psychrobacter arenosus TaxID=256326 RepID=UPI001D128844
MKRFPETGQKPNTILYRKNNNNTVTSYATSDNQGMIIKRVDVTGAPHKRRDGTPIPTPHVLEYGRTTDPSGTVRPNTPRKAEPRPAYPEEIQYIK